jgi:hypothetical protein
MISGSLSSSPWLQEFEGRARAFVRDERPASLIEFEVAAVERERLYRELGKQLPWLVSSECPAAIAVATVQAAADAAEGDEAYIRHFLGRIGRKGDRPAWDNEYGPATETFFVTHFDHSRKSGPWRYVRTVFRHAGIVLVGVRAYAEMLDRLLIRGTQFTYPEYLSAVRRVSSTLIRPFLLTPTGFKFTRTTSEYLRRHQRGELSVPELEGLRGYREGFWPELLANLKKELGVGSPNIPPAPHLALDHERCYVVLRFPREWQMRGTYRLGGNPVTYPDQRVRGSRPTHVQIGQKSPEPVSPWWSVGKSRVAVFRAADGGFVGGAEPGGEQDWPLRAGSYFVVAEQSLSAELEKLQALPVGPLEVLPQDDAEPPYDVWQVDLAPASTYVELGLKTIGRAPLPALSFVNHASSYHHLGPTVFGEKLPAIRISSWTEEASAQFAIRLAFDGKEQQVHVPPGTSRFDVTVPTPCQGRVWIEPRGYSSAADALAGLDFTVVPSQLRIAAADDILSVDDGGRVVAELPVGWRIEGSSPGIKSLDGRTWLAPAGLRVFDATVVAPSFKLPVSVRLPFVSLAARDGSKVVWLEDLKAGDPVDCDLEGPAFASCDIALQSEDRPILIASGIRLGEFGSRRLTLRSFVDSIDGSALALARVELLFGTRSILTDLWCGSLERLASELGPWTNATSLTEDSLLQVPGIGPALASIFVLKRQPVPSVVIAQTVKELARPGTCISARVTLQKAIVDSVLLSAVLEAIAHDLPPDVLPSPEAAEIIDFVQQADAVVSIHRERVMVSRWRDGLAAIKDERNDESEAADLLIEWHEALLANRPCRLAERAGGYHLTDAARRYCEALALSSVKLRNQALTLVLGSLDRSQEASKEGSTVHTMSEILRQLALVRTGRFIDANRIETLHRPRALARAINDLRALASLSSIQCEDAGLSLGDLLPCSSEVAGKES